MFIKKEAIKTNIKYYLWSNKKNLSINKLFFKTHGQLELFSVKRIIYILRLKKSQLKFVNMSRQNENVWFSAK
jgi:hypothetical protein